MQPGPLLSFHLLPFHQPLQGQGMKWLILHSFAGMVFPSSHPKQSQDTLFVDFTAYLGVKFRAGFVPLRLHTFRVCSTSKPVLGFLPC